LWGVEGRNEGQGGGDHQATWGAPISKPTGYQQGIISNHVS
jgi:hypothetical protein